MRLFDFDGFHEVEEDYKLNSKARRPRIFGYQAEYKKKAKRNRNNVGQLELRFADARDLWTGLPLSGKDLEDWLALQDEKQEKQMSIEEIRRAG